MISASAPGKVILWGEYAVLRGAPALVMAVDRRAVCSIEIGRDRDRGAAADATWLFATRGFSAPDAELQVSDLTADHPPQQPAARAAWHVIQDLLGSADRSSLPGSARVVTDTGAFYQSGEKLGIGSSAAVCTAIYAACCELLGKSIDFAQALRIHNHFQAKSGSGIDVAAAFLGDTLRFQAQRATPFCLDPDLQLRFVWTGQAAATTSHIRRFNAWVERGRIAPLTALARTCHGLFEHPNLTTLHRYAEELKALDAAAELGIYDGGHRQLDRLAIDAEVVYKPCGAGGGDVGVAISDQGPRLDAFIAAAVDLGFDSLTLEKARDGIQVAR